MQKKMLCERKEIEEEVKINFEKEKVIEAELNDPDLWKMHFQEATHHVTPAIQKEKKVESVPLIDLTLDISCKEGDELDPVYLLQKQVINLHNQSIDNIVRALRYMEDWKWDLLYSKAKEKLTMNNEQKK